MTTTPNHRRRCIKACTPIVLLLAAAALAGCGEPARPVDRPEASLFVTANLNGAPIDTVVVEVTAADIPVPLLFNLDIVNGTAQGTITIPAGSARRITLRTFDTGGIETHSGSTTIDIDPGTNPTVTVVLIPHAGQQPIVVTLSSLVVRVSPVIWTLGRGATVQLVGAIEDAFANPVTGQILWATRNPGRARVSSSGVVTAGPSHGPVIIRGTFSGVAAEARIMIEGPLSAGATHSCGLDASGAAWCWGDNGNGQLGVASPLSSTVPVAVQGGPTFQSLYTGGGHSCGLTAAGAAWCWGLNGYGQVGDGTASDRSAPTAVSGGLSFRSLALGLHHTCGITTTGSTYCWGFNDFGQLGDGGFSSLPAPVQVATSATFTALAAGGRSTCALDTSGAAHCWGEIIQAFGGSFLPIAIGGVPPLVQLAVGGLHACGVNAAEEAYCWGDNTYGQLGDGSFGGTFLTLVGGGVRLVAVEAGETHTCGITVGGAAYCWGSNANGRLGDGTSSDRPLPAWAGSGFVSISAGTNHTCAVAVGGTPYCWGSNTWGLVGDGTTDDRPSPTTVSGGLLFP